MLSIAIRQEQLDRVIVLAKAYGATRLILFGSASTAPERARDLDLACDGVGGWKLYELGARLEEELRMPLDLVPLNPLTGLCCSVYAGHLIKRYNGAVEAPGSHLRLSPWGDKCR